MFEWLFELFGKLIDALVGIIKDAFIWVLDIFFELMLLIINSIPAPDFIEGQTMGTLLNGLPSGLLYFLDRSGLPEAVAVIGVAYVFRLTRKFVTLFRW